MTDETKPNAYETWFDQVDPTDVTPRPVPQDLLAAVRGRRRRRQTLQAGLAAAGLALAVWTALWLTNRGRNAAGSPGTTDVVRDGSGDPGSRDVAPPGPPTFVNGDFEWVEGRSTRTTGWVVETGQVPAEWFVDDEEAIRLLRESGSDGGFLRLEGRTIYTGELRKPPPPDGAGAAEDD